MFDHALKLNTSLKNEKLSEKKMPTNDNERWAVIIEAFLISANFYENV